MHLYHLPQQRFLLRPQSRILTVSFGETVTITPRSFLFIFRKAERQDHHYAMIGMASANDSFPAVCRGCQRKGPCNGGSKFPGECIFISNRMEKAWRLPRLK